MANIEKLVQDLAVISKLSDYPGSQDGLSTEEFKAKFDEAPLAIQQYLNEVIVPAIEEATPEEGASLPATGGTMQGNINMDGNKVTGLGTPSDDTDAVPKSYVLPKTGGTMSGAIAMGGNKVTGLGTPTADADAATKAYVDGKRIEKTVSVPASGWQESGAGSYTQGITVGGILPTDTPHYGVVLSGTTDEMIAQRDAFALIDDLDAANSVIVLTCLEEKPEIDLTIHLEVNRGGGSGGASVNLEELYQASMGEEY